MDSRHSTNEVDSVCLCSLHYGRYRHSVNDTMHHQDDKAGFGLTEIAAAAAIIAPFVRITPCHALPRDAASRELGNETEVLLKLELLQVTGTFKARGVFSVMAQMPDAVRERGVTAVSAGNHAVAVAYAARAFGVSAKVVMISTASEVRVAAARECGAEVLFANDGPTAFALAEELSQREGRTFVHPFEGRDISLGTGTLGLEFWEQAGSLDAVVVAIGGGGLASGVATAIKLKKPACAVYGVEPKGADSMHRSFVSGSPQRIDRVTTIADSLGAPMALPYSFALCRANLNGVVLVDDEQICRAMSILYRGAKVVAEPAGAAALAGLLGPLREELRARRVGVIVCGGNIDIANFAKYVQRGESLRDTAAVSGD